MAVATDQDRGLARCPPPACRFVAMAVDVEVDVDVEVAVEVVVEAAAEVLAEFAAKDHVSLAQRAVTTRRHWHVLVLCFRLSTGLGTMLPGAKSRHLPFVAACPLPVSPGHSLPELSTFTEFGVFSRSLFAICDHERTHSIDPQIDAERTGARRRAARSPSSEIADDLPLPLSRPPGHFGNNRRLPRRMARVD